MPNPQQRCAEISRRALASYNEGLRLSAKEWRKNHWLKLTEAQKAAKAREAALNLNGALARRILNMRKFYPTDDDISKTTEQGKPDEQSE